MEKVYVEEFVSLTKSELPVDYSMMKKIIPVSKIKGLEKLLKYNDVEFKVVFFNDQLYAHVFFPMKDFIYECEKIEKELLDYYFVYWILSVLYLEKIYDGSQGNVFIFDDVFFPGFNLENVDFYFHVDEWCITSFDFPIISLKTVEVICNKIAEIFDKYRLNPTVFEKTKDILIIYILEAVS